MRGHVHDATWVRRTYVERSGQRLVVLFKRAGLRNGNTSVAVMWADGEAAITTLDAIDDAVDQGQLSQI